MDKILSDKLGKITEKYCKDMEGILADSGLKEVVVNGRYNDDKKSMIIDIYLKNEQNLRISSKELNQ